MQAVVLGFQLPERFQTVVGNIAGAGGGVFVDLQHGGLLAVQAGVAVGGVVDDFHVCHIRKTHIAVAVHVQQQGTGNILHAAVLLTDLQQPGLSVLVLHIAGRHRKVLGVDQLSQRIDIQLLCHVCLRQSRGLGGLVLLLGGFQLLFVFVEHLAGFSELHVGVQLLLREAAQCIGKLTHQLRHIVHGLDGAFQRRVDHVQAVLQLHLVGKILCGAALRAGLGVYPLLQLLQSHGQLIRDGAQLRHDLDEGVDVPHTGLVELVHDLLQAVPHLDERLLDLRLLDYGDQAVDAFQKRLRLPAHHINGVAHLHAHGTHNRIRHGIAEILHLLFVFLASGCDLSFGAVQLCAGVRELCVNQLQQAGVDLVDLFLIQLHLHQLFHKAARRNAGHTALALDVGHHGILDKIRQFIDITALAADRHRHKGVHVQAVLNDRGRQAGVGQVALSLIQLIGHLDQSTVHIRVIRKLHQQQAVVFC